MVMEPITQIDEGGITRLTKDLKDSAALLGPQQVRFLVDDYYQMQDNRTRAKNQERALNESGEPSGVIEWQAKNALFQENQIKNALAAFAAGQVMGRWMLDIMGIGPVIAAGLLAHIDIAQAPTAGSIWRYAGLDPTSEWKKGEKRPWNASLKVLCWKLGESFVKVSNNENDVYGKLYKTRKDIEIAKNERGDFADQAEAKLAKFNIGKTTDAYKAYSVGKLPPAHIHSRAKRVAVKMFLSHLHEVWWTHQFGTPPPVPYVFSLADHTHKIEPPELLFKHINPLTVAKRASLAKLET
jgi:hypothetical protein